MLEIFDNLRKKNNWPRKREAPTSWTTRFRMKDSYPSFLQIDLPFTHRASYVSSCQSLFLVFFSVKPLKKISLATNIPGKFAEIYFCCCLFVVVFVVLLYCLFLYHFASGSCSLTLASLQAHMPFGPSVLIQVYSSAGSWETPRHYLTVCSYGLALGMRDGELEKLWGGGRGRSNKKYIYSWKEKFKIREMLKKKYWFIQFKNSSSPPSVF